MIVFPPFDIELAGVHYSNNANVEQVFIEDAPLDQLTSVRYEDIPALIEYLNQVMIVHNAKCEYKKDRAKYDEMMEAKS